MRRASRLLPVSTGGTRQVRAACRITGNAATLSSGGIFKSNLDMVNLTAGADVRANEAPSGPQCNFDNPASQDVCPTA